MPEGVCFHGGRKGGTSAGFEDISRIVLPYFPYHIALLTAVPKQSSNIHNVWTKCFFYWCLKILESERKTRDRWCQTRETMLNERYLTVVVFQKAAHRLAWMTLRSWVSSTPSGVCSSGSGDWLCRNAAGLEWRTEIRGIRKAMAMKVEIKKPIQSGEREMYSETYEVASKKNRGEMPHGLISKPQRQKIKHQQKCWTRWKIIRKPNNFTFFAQKHT